MAKTPPSKKASAATKAPAKGAGGRPAGLFTWILVGLVVVVAAAFVIIKVASGNTTSPASGFQATDPTVVRELTSIPASVFNTVGVTSTVAPVTPPQILKGQPALTGTSSTGATVPGILYVGAEYCPFCAAQRWPLIIALSRFGTWSGLGDMVSSTHPGEYAPGTPTFTFVKSAYKSKYLAFQSVEEFDNVFNSSQNFYSSLQKPTKAQNALFHKYDTSTYVKGITAAQNLSIPFMTIGNRFLVSGSSFTPLALASLTRGAIATGLSDPTSPVTVAIIASANYQTAAFCSLTKNLPGSVCNSPGVKAAKKAMAIK